MEQKTLSASLRTELKSSAANRMRKEGKIPAVVYGHGAPLHVSVLEREFSRKFKTISENTIISLECDNKKTYSVLVKDFQEDILSSRVLHIDFYEIESGKVLKTHVPIHLTGTSPGVREGGILEQFLHNVEVECLPKDLPEQIVVDISSMKIGSAVHVGELNVGSGVKIHQAADQVVVTVAHQRAEAAPAEEAAAAAEGETPAT